MVISRRSILAASAGALPLARHASTQSAPSFPLRAVTWIVPYPPGGFGDTVTRTIAQQMTTILRTPVVVDNRPGAGGQIAAAHVKKLPADGHTLFHGDIGTFAMNPGLYRRLNYDTLKDFAPVTRVLKSSLVLVVSPSSPYKTFDDLIEAARRVKDDQSITYGSFGIGSFPHIWVELLQREVKGAFRHIAYKGAGPALQDLMGGQIDMLLDVAANSIPYAREGRLRALTIVGSEKRLERLAHIPTVAELGYPSLNASGWTGVVVRAGTPVNVVEQLHAAVQQAIQSGEIERLYGGQGIVPAPQRPADFSRYVQAEIERWGAVIRTAGVVLE